MLDKNYQCFIKGEKKAKRFWKLAKRCGYSWCGGFEAGGGPDKWWSLSGGSLLVNSQPMVIDYEKIKPKKLKSLLIAGLCPIGSTVRVIRKATKKELDRIKDVWAKEMDSYISEKLKVVGIESFNRIRLSDNFCYPHEVLVPVTAPAEDKASEDVTAAESKDPGKKWFCACDGLHFKEEKKKGGTANYQGGKDRCFKCGFYPWTYPDNPDVKSADPLIRGRWLTYEGKNYYAIERITEYHEKPERSNVFDVLFKDIRYRKPDSVDITDAMACSRIDLGPVWVYVWDESEHDSRIEKLVFFNNDNQYPYTTEDSCYINARLATPEEIGDL